MPNLYTPEPLEQRQSQKVGFSHYLREVAPILGLSALGSGGGYLLGMLRGGSRGLYATVGGHITGFVTAFIVWRRKEKEHVGIDDISQQLDGRERLFKGNDEIAADNAWQKRLLAHEEERGRALAAPSASWQEKLAAEPDAGKERGA